MLVVPESSLLFDEHDELLYVMNSFGDDSNWNATTDSFSMSGVHSLAPQPTVVTNLVLYYDPTNTLQHAFNRPSRGAAFSIQRRQKSSFDDRGLDASELGVSLIMTSSEGMSGKSRRI